MPDLAGDAEPFALADVDLRAVLLDAELPSLLPALAHLTGDLSLLREEFRPAINATPLGLEPQGGLSPAAQERARDLAAQAIRDWAGRGRPAASTPDDERLRRMMEFVTGEVEEDYLPLFRHQLGIHDAPPRPVARGADFRVVVIGAGMSGLAATHRLRQAGIPVLVLERNEEVGGVWWENSYPGCRLDTSNFSYSYSFAQQPTWRYHYSTRDSILDYFTRVTDDLGLRRFIRFGTEVVSAVFDEHACRWRLRTRTAGGMTETVEADAVISAVGQLNRPRYPDVPGRERFAGPSWHTARWNHGESLAGRRVAVIGTGASSFQVVPQIAGSVAELTLFQRTPPWIVPTATYHSLLKPGLRWLFRHVPGYHRWFRFYQFWVNVEGRRPFALVDPGWTDHGSISARNQALREALTAHLRQGYADRPDLLAGAVPAYPPYAKRMLRDDGTWFRTLKRSNVTVVTDPIAEIAPHGVVTGEGTLHPADVIIYGTGFRASEFLSRMRVTGRGGVDLHEQWDGDARACLGVTVPNFPNFFLLYGPNTNLVVNGSIVMFSEFEVDYVMACLATLLGSPHRTMECRWEALEHYYRRVDEASSLMAWGTPGASSWYKNASGRVSQNWPLSTFEFYRRTRAPVVEDYDFR
ncbi:MAG: putative flavin-containing monooxygenase [Actinoallomurus sp.]|nr:putative flavin-containing monooxygenase [Actinoallomurus sp.]